MNAELPSFKNGEHNSETVSTIDRVVTPLKEALIAKNATKIFGGIKKSHLPLSHCNVFVNKMKVQGTVIIIQAPHSKRINKLPSYPKHIIRLSKIYSNNSAHALISIIKITLHKALLK